MAFKFIIFAAIVAVAQAGLLRSAILPASTLRIDHGSTHLGESQYIPSEGSNPSYEFKYGVHDSISGDSKSAHEIRNGDLTQGTYSLNDPDGTRRTVDYISTPLSGFQATVRKEPIVEATAFLPASEPILAKTIAEAPIELKKYESKPESLIELKSTKYESKPESLIELKSTKYELKPESLIELKSTPTYLRTPTLLSAVPSTLYNPHTLTRLALPATNLLRSNLHYGSDLRFASLTPSLRYISEGPIATPVHLTRTDAGLTGEVLNGFATGLRSYTASAPTLLRSW